MATESETLDLIQKAFDGVIAGSNTNRIASARCVVAMWKALGRGLDETLVRNWLGANDVRSARIYLDGWCERFSRQWRVLEDARAEILDRRLKGEFDAGYGEGMNNLQEINRIRNLIRNRMTNTVITAYGLYKLKAKDVDVAANGLLYIKLPDAAQNGLRTMHRIHEIGKRDYEPKRWGSRTLLKRTDMKQLEILGKFGVDASINPRDPATRAVIQKAYDMLGSLLARA
jgi:hypothetical protein